jgi:hypothetical protein
MISEITDDFKVFWVGISMFSQSEQRHPRRLIGVSRVFRIPFAAVYPLYVEKVEKKGRTKAELDQVLEWLTGFDGAGLKTHIDTGTTLEDFFADAKLNAGASLISGVVCGIRVEDIEDPLMQKFRYMDKLVDELARGKALEKVLRSQK